MRNYTLPVTTVALASLMLIASLAPGASALAKKRRTDTSGTVAAQGHTLFLTNCSPCHGANAEGDDGPNLHKKNLPDTFIASAVKSGFKDEMPPFGKKLSAADVKALVAYVHSLQK